MPIIVTRASSEVDIAGILTLHQENFVANLTPEEKAAEGFVTAAYAVSDLRKMHELLPAIIAKDEARVVGYVLVVPRSFFGQHPLLDELMIAVNKLQYQDESLDKRNYVLCGQLCVAKGYRGQGLAQKMYEYFRQELRGQFDYCITDVASSNPRSLKAHAKCGFKVIDSTAYDGVTFDIILWDWNK